MPKKVKLSEATLNKIIKESVIKALNEISDRTVSNAEGASSYYNRVLEEINEKFEDLEKSLADIAGCGWNDIKPLNNEAKGIYDDLSSVFERFKHFYARKQHQFDSFQDELFNKRGNPDIE